MWCPYWAIPSLGEAPKDIPFSEMNMPVNELDLNPVDPVTPRYQDALDVRDSQDLQAALKEGESFITNFQGPGDEIEPTQQNIIEKPPSVKEIINTLSQNVDAAYRDELKNFPRDALSVPDLPKFNGPQTNRNSADQGLNPALAGMLSELVKQWNKKPNIKVVTYPALPKDENKTTPTSSKSRQSSKETQKQLIAAGSDFYSTVKYSVNSDYRTPVVIDIHEEPLRGAVLTGTFEQVRDTMVLHFTKMNYRRKIYSIDAYAVDFDCACFGNSGDVDHHIFERIIFPAAVNFASGFLAAAARPLTTLSIDGSSIVAQEFQTERNDFIFEGAAKAGEGIANVLNENAHTGPTVIINQNQEVAVVFIEPVLEGKTSMINPSDRSPENIQNMLDES